MRYDSFPNSNQQPSDSLRADTPPVFIPLRYCFAYCFALRHPAGVCMHPSSLWFIILQCLGGDQSTIPHMKGDIHSFNMRYSGMPCPKDLQRYGPGEGPCESPLVLFIISSLQCDDMKVLRSFLMSEELMFPEFLDSYCAVYEL